MYSLLSFWSQVWDEFLAKHQEEQRCKEQARQEADAAAEAAEQEAEVPPPPLPPPGPWPARPVIRTVRHGTSQFEPKRQSRLSDERQTVAVPSIHRLRPCNMPRATQVYSGHASVVERIRESMAPCCRETGTVQDCKHGFCPFKMR